MAPCSGRTRLSRDHRRVTSCRSSPSASVASPPGCGEVGEVADDGTPQHPRPSALTVSDLRAWWNSTGRGRPSRLGIAIEDLIAPLRQRGRRRRSPGDMALAQAVLETGYFTNSDTAINNFAGIAHYDGAASGSAFVDPTSACADPARRSTSSATTPPLANPNVAPGPGRQRRRGVGSPDLGISHDVLDFAQLGVRVDARSRWLRAGHRPIRSIIRPAALPRWGPRRQR